MSVTHISLIVLFVILLISGTLILLKSKQVNDWAFNWSYRYKKPTENASFLQIQRNTSLRILRICFIVYSIICAGVLFSLISNISW
jgi:hypothetical protein